MPSYQLIDTKTVTSSTNTVSFTVIPQTFTDLVIWGQARNSANNYGGFYMYFNNTYSGMSYGFMRGYDTSSVQTGSQASTVDLAQFPINQDTPSTAFANVEYYIPQYASTSKTKMYRADSGRAGNFGANGTSIRMANGFWNSTNAINRIDLFGDTDNFAVGTKFWLYGI